MDLNLTITLSDRMFGLLEDKLPNLGRRIRSAVKKELGAAAHSETEIKAEIAPTATSPGEINTQVMRDREQLALMMMHNGLAKEAETVLGKAASIKLKLAEDMPLTDEDRAYLVNRLDSRQGGVL